MTRSAAHCSPTPGCPPAATRTPAGWSRRRPRAVRRRRPGAVPGRAVRTAAVRRRAGGGRLARSPASGVRSRGLRRVGDLHGPVDADWRVGCRGRRPHAVAGAAGGLPAAGPRRCCGGSPLALPSRPSTRCARCPPHHPIVARAPPRPRPGPTREAAALAAAPPRQRRRRRRPCGCSAWIRCGSPPWPPPSRARRAGRRRRGDAGHAAVAADDPTCCRPRAAPPRPPRRGPRRTEGPFFAS